MAKHLIFITCLLFAFVLSSCQNKNKINGHWQEIPDHVGWINDFEDVLSAEEETNLTQLVKNYEKGTSVEIAVITIPATAVEADKFDDLVLRIANEWGVGKAEKNNGILIGISKGHKTIRISNGYGIEKVLTDEQTKDIITDFFIPNFRKGDFYNGLSNGIEALIKALNVEKNAVGAIVYQNLNFELGKSS
ncbi:TPM domain-containing protein [Sphingobacterium bambusae]|uniref:TPM domain-containing protein n=1 Tax=Sphingobacterium bambusae TaxID=662858 RepID=A0ABW6BHT9_9SPHI|nr:TPM domain-containing protein [Sphingobacterium bambusae]WPL47519.1 TPM domain-containing protein [Sphingobacterium bambusae]